MYTARASFVGAVMLLAFAASATAQTLSVATPGGSADVVTVNGTVVSVDPTTRMLEVKTADGTRVVTTVAPQVTNLGTVKVGDRVVVRQIMPVAVSASRVGSATAPAASTGAGSAMAPGSKSSQAKVDTEEVTATVQSIDPPARTVVLRAPDGTVRTVKVQPEVDLSQVSVGDQATLRITRATAIAIDTSPAP